MSLYESSTLVSTFVSPKKAEANKQLTKRNKRENKDNEG